MTIELTELAQKIIENLLEQTEGEPITVVIQNSLEEKNFAVHQCANPGEDDLHWAQTKAWISLSSGGSTLDYYHRAAITKKIPLADYLDDHAIRHNIGGVVIKHQNKVLFSIGVHGLKIPKGASEFSSPPLKTDFPNHVLAVKGKKFAEELLKQE